MLRQMETSEDITQQIRATLGSLDPSLSVVHIEALSILPHSCVSRVTVDDGTTLIFKCAGSEEFAVGMHKELVVNRDVLSRLPEKVGPTLLYSSDINALPWLVPPGNSVIIEFVADVPGTFYYYCPLPGHRTLGMEGKLVVRKDPSTE